MVYNKEKIINRNKTTNIPNTPNLINKDFKSAFETLK